MPSLVNQKSERYSYIYVKSELHQALPDFTEIEKRKEEEIVSSDPYIFGASQQHC